MPRKRARRKHTAKATIENLNLTKAGTSINLEIKADEEKLGTFVIGRGSMTWYGNNWKNGRSFSWSKFAAFMEK